jgi:hypothetical protein
MLGPKGGLRFKVTHPPPFSSSRPGSSFSRYPRGATNSKVYAGHYAARAAT